jgi:KaiC/GvpD/RAD55 family RecA-like ATPase
MFKDSLPGMNKLIRSDPLKGSVILITGEPGTLKSSFAFSVMSSYLKRHRKEKGVYVTIEEMGDGHIGNLKSLGIKVLPNLRIMDIASFKADGVPESVHLDYISMITDRVEGSCYALDSLDALRNLVRSGISKEKENDDRTGQKTMDLFNTLRKKNAINLIITETKHEDSTSHSPELHLADGIIELGFLKTGVTRYIRIRKMKGVSHSLHPYAIKTGKKGLRVGNRVRL